ncbi:lytic transglycosylase domain-containing protein [Pyxidicoccus sp. MSG2]|uniref:lytic transglycosylase domain-containing protein n=1 Tax=Pyxidicoccus sp. MSG2 TaxID=2996790 RepID=UPI00227199FE|nr:lytic transglycosylase domain-containing protein [Pyxidicoccus sp. MSG2]MCY1023942.1 lytic transglycosylase domain-containing protein [Pyxidicoccus sp. MSG2]
MLLLLTLVLSAAPPPFDTPTPFEREIDAAVAATVPTYPVPRELVKAVIRRESAFNPKARSKAGALGLMQVMPFNAPLLGVTVEDLVDPARNILAGTRLLAVLLRHYQGDVISVLVAYNARPRELGAPLPDNGETPEYVRSVLGFFYAYRAAAGMKHPVAAPQTSAAVRSTGIRTPPPTR